LRVRRNPRVPNCTKMERWPENFAERATKGRLRHQTDRPWITYSLARKRRGLDRRCDRRARARARSSESIALSGQEDGGRRLAADRSRDRRDEIAWDADPVHARGGAAGGCASLNVAESPAPTRPTALASGRAPLRHVAPRARGSRRRRSERITRSASFSTATSRSSATATSCGMGSRASLRRAETPDILLSSWRAGFCDGRVLDMVSP
jgi:hypothetical protein